MKIILYIGFVVVHLPKLKNHITMKKDNLNPVVKIENTFILWATHNGIKVYTDQDRIFSFTENVKKEVCSILYRGFPVETSKGEFAKTEILTLNNISGNSTFIGNHKVYTQIKIN